MLGLVGRVSGLELGLGLGYAIYGSKVKVTVH